ncbi:MAG: hypothetical protein KatS3mg001_190 [Candidatus Pacearchaeota archaeon]|nr:MAG: hypothetical protein KatS3mg001_190 [Candidatus Pacearchaeota archaeon]
MFVNIIKSYRNIVAVCDEELLGKYFSEGNFQLEVKESFFYGNSYSEDETILIMKKMFKEDATFNIVGENSVRAAIKAEIINEDCIKRIQNIPFALVLL